MPHVRAQAGVFPAIVLSATAAILSGCAAFTAQSAQAQAAQASKPDVPSTVGEQEQGPAYSYRPLDPLSVDLEHAQGVPVTNCRILELLPDETVRLAISELDASGNVSYGPVKFGAEGHRYRVVLDYIKSATTAVTVPSGDQTTSARVVPTYVGVGLRLTADLYVKKGNVDLSNLVLIGAAGQADEISGTLVFQTLGISGPTIILPLPSEISANSIQNALVAIGTIKSHIYDAQTTISPRVVGIYNDLGSDSKSFDDYFNAVLAKPPKLTERANSSQCPPPPSVAVPAKKKKT